jgi:Arm DNA-binding domain
MRGSVRKRGSTYSYWLDIGPDPVTGKRRQRTKGGFRTKRECQAALNEAISAEPGPAQRVLSGVAYKGPPQQGRRAGAKDGSLHPFDPAPGAARCGALGLRRAERGRCC